MNETMDETRFIIAAVFFGLLYIVIAHLSVRDLAKLDRKIRQLRKYLTEHDSELKSDGDVINHCMDSLHAALKAKHRILKIHQKRSGKPHAMDKQLIFRSDQPLRELVNELDNMLS